MEDWVKQSLNGKIKKFVGFKRKICTHPGIFLLSMKSVSESWNENEKIDLLKTSICLLWEFLPSEASDNYVSLIDACYQIENASEDINLFGRLVSEGIQIMRYYNFCIQKEIFVLYSSLLHKKYFRKMDGKKRNSITLAIEFSRFLPKII